MCYMKLEMPQRAFIAFIAGQRMPLVNDACKDGCKAWEKPLGNHIYISVGDQVARADD